MRIDLDNKLVETFPKLYKDRNADMHQTAMCWGFECGDGWFDIIWRLSSRLEYLINQVPEEEQGNYRAAQVKEKYGGLRFYMTLSTDKMNEVIQLYEDMSYEICEICGELGKVNIEGWLMTRCERCRMGKHVEEWISAHR